VVHKEKKYNLMKYGELRQEMIFFGNLESIFPKCASYLQSGATRKAKHTLSRGRLKTAKATSKQMNGFLLRSLSVSGADGQHHRASAVS
jgi:hypothetical protein